VVASARELVVRDRAGQWTPEFRALRASMGMPPHAAIGMSPRAAIGMPAGG
jgi:hypothetical protein